MKHENLPKSDLTRRQFKVFQFTNIETTEYGLVDIEVKIRHDDRCGNGHNTFSMTGSIHEAGKRKVDRYMIVCGAISDIIEKYIPELAHLAKWHGCHTDEPLYYVANTMYHARTKTHKNAEIGEAVAWNTRLKFEGIPFTFAEHEKGFWDYLNRIDNFNGVKVETVKYDGESTYNYGDNYSLAGYIKKNDVKKWYKSPFKSLKQAQEFLTALQNFKYEFVKTPTKFCEAAEPNLEAARKCAIWETATIEQLQDKELLLTRLPELMHSFKTDIESIGFVY